MTAVRNTFGQLRSVLDIFGSAIRVANAVENGGKPALHDLRRLGVDPRAFTTIGHG